MEMADPSDRQLAELKSAIDRLNAAMADIKQTGGEGVRVQPYTRFDDAAGLCAVYVEINTGRRLFGPD